MRSTTSATLVTLAMLAVPLTSFAQATEPTPNQAQETSANTSGNLSNTDTPPPENEQLSELDQTIADLDKEIAELEASLNEEASSEPMPEQTVTEEAEPPVTETTTISPVVKEAEVIEVQQEAVVQSSTTEESTVSEQVQAEVESDPEVVELMQELEAVEQELAEPTQEPLTEQTPEQVPAQDTAAQVNLVNDSEEKVGFTFDKPVHGESEVNIPVLDDARVFAQFVDKLPAVVNYFTQAQEDEVIAFYQQNYGDIIVQERKRGRLTLSFISDAYATRVVISQQDDKRQVDVIQELN